jgi:hypothetical protein
VKQRFENESLFPMKRFFTIVIMVILLLAPVRVWAQGSLRYTVVDIPDGPGGDLWEYSYFFNGFGFQANQGFSVYFDAGLFKDLQNPRPVGNGQWSMIAVQRDVVLNQPGYLDGQAVVNAPGFQGPFQVAFVWLGVGTPGSQPFDIYDSNFQTLFSGNTIVPEPQSWLLAIAGGLIVYGCRRRKS